MIPVFALVFCQSAMDGERYLSLMPASDVVERQLKTPPRPLRWARPGQHPGEPTLSAN